MKRVFLVLLLAAGCVTTVAAQTTGSASKTPTVQANDFSNIGNLELIWQAAQPNAPGSLTQIQYLFPDSAWYLNPSVVVGLKKRLVLSHLAYSNAGGTTTLTNNTSANGGAVGGTQVTTTSNPSTYLNLAGFMPVGKNMVAGVGGFFNDFYSAGASPSTTVSTNYTANPQNLTVDGATKPVLKWNGNSIFAMPLGPVDLGASFYYNGSYTSGKAQFQKSTDPNVAGGKAYYAVSPTLTPYTVTAGPFYDANTTLLWGNLGARMRFGRFSFGLASSYQRTTTDNSNGSIAVDESGNGYAQTIVPLSTYETSTAAWGAGNPVFSYVNTTTGTGLSVLPSVRYRLEPYLAILLDGYWAPIDETSTQTYAHLTTTDKSNATTNLNSGIDNFQAVAGVEVNPLANLAIRAGGGIARLQTNFSQSDILANGSSLYVSGNSNNYAQTAVFSGGSSQPSVGDIVTYSGNQPTTSTQTTYLGLVSVSWTPFPRITLFSGSGVSDSITSRTYNVYDTTTNTVWSQTISNNSGSWAFNSLIGVAIQVTKDLSLSITTNEVTESGTLGGSNTSVPTASGTKSTSFANTTGTSTSSVSATVGGVVSF